MDRYKVFPSGELGMHPTGNWTPYADAQATVAALQAQLESANALLHKKNCAIGKAETTIEALQRERDEAVAWKGRYEAAQALVNGAYEQIGEQQTALDAEREKVARLEAAANYYKQPSKNGGVYSVSGGHIGNLMDWCKDNLKHCKFSGPDEDNLDLDLVQTAQQIPQLKTELSQLQALVRAKEDAYEKILLSRERLEREMRGYPPVDNEGIPMVWQEPVGWVKRHPGRYDASNY